MSETDKQSNAALEWFREQKRRLDDGRAYLRTPEGKNLIPAVATGASLLVGAMAGLQFLIDKTKPVAAEDKPPIHFVCDPDGDLFMAVDVGNDTMSTLDDIKFAAPDMVILGKTEQGLHAIRPIGWTIYSQRESQTGFRKYYQEPPVIRAIQSPCRARMAAPPVNSTHR